jgi:hypothetical protein
VTFVVDSHLARLSPSVVQATARLGAVGCAKGMASVVKKHSRSIKSTSIMWEITCTETVESDNINNKKAANVGHDVMYDDKLLLAALPAVS